MKKAGRRGEIGEATVRKSYNLTERHAAEILKLAVRENVSESKILRRVIEDFLRKLSESNHDDDGIDRKLAK